jgi:hypothetical protein
MCWTRLLFSQAVQQYYLGALLHSLHRYDLHSSKNSGQQMLQTLPVAGAFPQHLTKIELPSPQTARLHPTKMRVWLQSIHLSCSLATYHRRTGFFEAHQEFHQHIAAVLSPTYFRSLGLAFLCSPSPPSFQTAAAESRQQNRDPAALPRAGASEPNICATQHL